MSTARTADVVVAGGGFAGASVAAALGESGYEVLVVEPGLDRSKRLAGELIHPPGATDLATLGLRDRLRRGSMVPVHGFAVLPEGDADAYVLRYGEIPGLEPHGFTIDHADLAAGLGDALARLPHVTVWSGARVTGVDLHHPDFAAVTVSRDGRRRASQGAPPRRGGRGELADPRVGRYRPRAGADLPHGRIPLAGCTAAAPRIRQRVRRRPGAHACLRHRRQHGSADVRRAGEPARHRGAEPRRRVLPGASRAVPEPGERGARNAEGARVGQLLDPAPRRLSRPSRPGGRRRRLLPSAHGDGLTASTRDAIHLRQALRETGTFRRPCGATRPSARDRSGRAWRSPSRSTGRSANRRRRCGSSATGSSGSGSGAVGAERPPWLSCRPTRVGCR